MQNQVKELALSSVEANAHALQEDFYKLINGQQQLREHLEDMKLAVCGQVERTYLAMSRLHTSLISEKKQNIESKPVMQTQRIPVDKPRDEKNSEDKGRVQSNSPINRVRKASVFGKHDELAEVRSKFLDSKVNLVPRSRARSESGENMSAEDDEVSTARVSFFSSPTSNISFRKLI